MRRIHTANQNYIGSVITLGHHRRTAWTANTVLPSPQRDIMLSFAFLQSNITRTLQCISQWYNILTIWHYRSIETFLHWLYTHDLMPVVYWWLPPRTIAAPLAFLLTGQWSLKSRKTNAMHPSISRWNRRFPVFEDSRISYLVHFNAKRTTAS